MRQLRTPVCDFVQDYLSSDMTRMHMPGHKGIDVTGWEKNDITEISGSGELYESSGPVGEGEAITAALFGTARTCWVTEGSSQCIRAMLALAAQRWREIKTAARTQQSHSAEQPAVSGEKPVILAARNVHRSFLTACALLDLSVRWIPAEGDGFTLCSCPVSAFRVENELREMKSLPAAVYLTSPDYLGELQDIKGIAKVCHEHHIPLLVDHAHGAYTRFLPVSLHPMDLGADLCCDSAHKTLPALTGCAYLHIARSAPEEFVLQAKRMLAMFGSTSPSWLLLQSLDLVNTQIAGEYPARLAECVHKIADMKEQLQEIGWHFHGREPLKLTIDTRAAGYVGSSLAQLLRRDRIECEYADPDYVVLMMTPMNTDRDLERVKAALEQIPIQGPIKKLETEFRIPPQVLSIREAMLGLSEEIPVSEAPGRIMAQAGMACPPAVPILTAGEQIFAEHLPFFHYYGIEKISVVKEIKCMERAGISIGSN